jgi:hypothetical protein
LLLLQPVGQVACVEPFREQLQPLPGLVQVLVDVGFKGRLPDAVPLARTGGEVGQIFSTSGGMPRRRLANPIASALSVNALIGMHSQFTFASTRKNSSITQTS